MFARVKAGAINGNLRQNKSVIIQKNGIICKTIECKQKKHVFLFGFQAEISKFKVIRLIYVVFLCCLSLGQLRGVWL
jgi:hypothetical protein